MGYYLITGANSDLGKAFINHLNTEGHIVIACSRSLITQPTNNDIDNIDLLSEPDLQKLQNHIDSHIPTAFTLIHSVGDFWIHKSIDKTSSSECISMIQSHYVSLFNVIKIIAPLMVKRGGGKIFAFSCNSVRLNYPYMAAFTSSKAAVECLVKCAANELSKHNIICNAFSLPSIRTEKVLNTKKYVLSDQFIEPQELAEQIIHLCETMSPIINGSIINIYKYNKMYYSKGYFERNTIIE